LVSVFAQTCPLAFAEAMSDADTVFAGAAAAGLAGLVAFAAAVDAPATAGAAAAAGAVVAVWVAASAFALRDFLLVAAVVAVASVEAVAAVAAVAVVSVVFLRRCLAVVEEVSVVVLAVSVPVAFFDLFFLAVVAVESVVAAACCAGSAESTGVIVNPIVQRPSNETLAQRDKTFFCIMSSPLEAGLSGSCFQITSLVQTRIECRDSSRKKPELKR
jgi:hypothetical protein